MVAPIVYGVAAGGVALYTAYKKGKSSGKSEGIEEGKEKKEEEITQELREEIRKEEMSKKVKEELKEKYNLEQKAKKEVDIEQSFEAHKEAKKRDPPVDIGDEVELGVEDIDRHHSGKITAVCNKEGFYIFVNKAPDNIREGDVVQATITSFGKERNSAQATFKGRSVG